MSQPLPVSRFKWVKNKSKFTSDFIMNYDVYSDAGYFLEDTIRYPKILHNKHKDLSFLAQKEKNNKCKKLICNVKDMEKYVVHTRASNQTLEHGLVLEEVHRVKV